MFTIKYRKHLYSFFLCLLLICSFSLNCFADSVGTYKFSDFNYSFDVKQGDSNPIDVTNEVIVTYGKASFDSLLNKNVTTFRYPAKYNSYRKIFLLNSSFSFKVNTEYSIAFDLTSNYSSSASFTIYLLFSFSDGSQSDLINIFDGNIKSSYSVNSVNANFTVPNYNKQFSVSFVVTASSNGGASTVGQAFFFTDLVISSPDDVPFDKPDIDTSGAQNSIDDMNNTISSVEADLPKIDVDELEGLIGGASVDNYITGFQALNIIFDDVVSTLDFRAVIVFCLSFGLAIYIIGRRLA